jgi:hypothetical protein
MPASRGLIVATVRSETLRTIARRATEDRKALLSDLVKPANVRHVARSAIRHPAAAELANAALVFLPGRYMPLGWAATWAARRVLMRYLDRPVEVRPIEAGGATLSEAGHPPAGVPPGGPVADRKYLPELKVRFAGREGSR